MKLHHRTFSCQIKKGKKKGKCNVIHQFVKSLCCIVDDPTTIFAAGKDDEIDYTTNNDRFHQLMQRQSLFHHILNPHKQVH